MSFVKERKLNLTKIKPALVILNDNETNIFSIYFLIDDSVGKSFEQFQNEQKGNWEARVIDSNGQKTPVSVHTKNDKDFSVEIDNSFGEYSIRTGKLSKNRFILGFDESTKYIGEINRNESKKDIYIINFKGDGGSANEAVDWVVNSIGKNPKTMRLGGPLGQEMVSH